MAGHSNFHPWLSHPGRSCYLLIIVPKRAGTGLQGRTDSGSLSLPYHSTNYVDYYKKFVLSPT